MTAGRKPLPLAVHKLNGNPSMFSEAELNPIEPELSDECPEAPKEVRDDPDAYEEWKRFVPKLNAAGIIKEIDRAACAQYCCLYGEFVKGLELLRKGRIIKNSKGVLAINPAFKIVTQTSQQMSRMLSEFGMTPSSRVRLKTAPKEKQDDLDDQLFGDEPNIKKYSN